MRLTQFARSGGCSSKIPAADLEAMVAGAFDRGPAAAFVPAFVGARLVCGTEWGDDASVVQVAEGCALVATADFFPPVVDDPHTWGRIAATNALSDIYAMGATPVSALNLLAWPADLPQAMAVEVLRGGRVVADEAGCVLAGGHSILDPVPKYGLAVTGMGDPDRLLRIDRARAGDPISLTKPLGTGMLCNLHAATGADIAAAVSVMTTSNEDASRAAIAAGVTAATDVTGFGLLGHLHKMARASGVTAFVDADAVPYIDGVREALAGGHIPGGTRRNLEWVSPFLDAGVDGAELLLLADAQTSGGLLVAGVVPGSPIIGRFVDSRGPTVIVR